MSLEEVEIIEEDVLAYLGLKLYDEAKWKRIVELSETEGSWVQEMIREITSNAADPFGGIDWVKVAIANGDMALATATESDMGGIDSATGPKEAILADEVRHRTTWFLQQEELSTRDEAQLKERIKQIIETIMNRCAARAHLVFQFGKNTELVDRLAADLLRERGTIADGQQLRERLLRRVEEAVHGMSTQSQSARDRFHFEDTKGNRHDLTDVEVIVMDKKAHWFFDSYKSIKADNPDAHSVLELTLVERMGLDRAAEELAIARSEADSRLKDAAVYFYERLPADCK